MKPSIGGNKNMFLRGIIKFTSLNPILIKFSLLSKKKRIKLKK